MRVKLSDCSRAFCERSFVCLFLFALEKKWNIEMDGMCEGGRCAVCCCCCCCCVCVSVWYVFVCLYRSHMRGCLVVGPLRATLTTYYCLVLQLWCIVKYTANDVLPVDWSHAIVMSECCWFATCAFCTALITFVMNFTCLSSAH